MFKNLVLICVMLTPALLRGPVRPDSDHIQQSIDYLSQGSLASAEKEARLALRESSSKPEALVVLGMIRRRQKRFAEATQFLTRALQLAPSSADARLALSQVYAGSGKREQARQEIRKLLESDPHKHEAVMALADLEETSGNFRASLKAAEPIFDDLQRSADGILLLARDYAGLKQKESLAALVPDWNSLPEAPAASSVAFASLLEKSGLDAQGLKVLEKAKSGGAVSVDLALTLGNLYLKTGDLSQAFESYEAALSLDPKCVHCMRQLAKIAAGQKDQEKALAYLIKAKRQVPNDPDVLFELGKTCMELDLLEDSLPALQRAVQLRPQNDSYAYVLGSAYVSKKQYEQAGKVFELLLKKHPRDPVLNYAMGSLLFLEVKLDDAAPYLRRSIELQPDQSAAYYYLGLIAEGKGQDSEAVSIFQKITERDPKYGPAYEAVGRVLLKQQKFAEARRALDKAVSLDPTSVKAHYQLGMLLGRMGQQDEAKKELAIVQELNDAESKRAGMRLRILSAH
jgi:tetratricopeptide (TPR) repeat protein